MQPVLITLNEIKSFHLNSFFHIMDNPQTPIVNTLETDRHFKKSLKEVYIPTFKFLKENQVKASLLVTGNFLERASQFNKNALKLIKELIDLKLVTIVAGPFYGENLSCVYNFNWWLDSVIRTIDLLENLLDYKPVRIYIPELYRKLPIEKIIKKTKIRKFILPTTKNMLKHSKIKLSEIRKDSNGTMPWIKNDVICKFTYIPEYLNFAINGNEFNSLDLAEAVKTCFMAIGFQSQELILKNKVKTKPSKIRRINENHSFSRYNSLQKSIIHLWEYISIISMTEIYKHPDSAFWKNLYEQLASIQNEDFLMYYVEDNYIEGNTNNFNSPYEAFAFMQSVAHQVEILIQHSV